MNAYHAEPRERPLTIEEFERLPEEDAYRIELVRGRMVREPRPAALHGWVLWQLARRLGTHIDEHRLGFFFIDIGVILSREPATVRGRDLVFVAAERLPSGPPPRGFLDLAPDLCVEIVSPSNTAAGVHEKVLEYLGAGTRLVWVVHPTKRTVAEYRSPRDVRVTGAGDALDGDDVVPGFRLPVAAIFAP
ncbi:MAG TPA: Uma2 family endonuclease [Longimicrobiales bacterium]